MLFAGTLLPCIREAYGYLQTRGKETEIIKLLKNGGDKIVEPLIIISHSMGSAYAKGFLKRIIEYVEAHPEECNGFYAIEYALAPYQPHLHSAVDHVGTYQYSHYYDFVAGFTKMDGTIYMNTTSDDNQGHGNGSFVDSIKDLPQGTYQYKNGKWEPIDNLSNN